MTPLGTRVYSDSVFHVDGALSIPMLLEELLQHHLNPVLRLWTTLPPGLIALSSEVAHLTYAV